MNDEVEPAERPANETPAESARERRLWIAAYVVIMLVLAAGAARRLLALF